MKIDNGRHLDAGVRASDLAQMGKCERLVVLEFMHGPRRSPSQEEARRRGVAAHVRYELEGRRAIEARARLATFARERA